MCQELSCLGPRFSRDWCGGDVMERGSQDIREHSLLLLGLRGRDWSLGESKASEVPEACALCERGCWPQGSREEQWGLWLETMLRPVLGHPECHVMELRAPPLR